MKTKSKPTKKTALTLELSKITEAYSEANREILTDEFLNVLKSSAIVSILNENSEPGTLRNVLDVCRSLGKIDASLSWIVGVANSAWSARSCFKLLESFQQQDLQNKIFAMVLGRPGILEKKSQSGGYLLSGEWQYASAWRYSSLFFCLAKIENEVRIVAAPSHQFELIEDWRATGLRATQSVAIRANKIHVPSHNTLDYASILSGQHSPLQHPSYSGLFTGVLMNCLLGAMLGAAEAGLDYLISSINVRPIAGSTYKRMSDSASIRSDIGRLHSNLDLYIRAAEYNADVIDQVALQSSLSLSIADRANVRARATQVMRGCVNIVQDLLWIYGSSGLNQGCPLERIWRDVNVGARHGGFTKLIPEEAAGLTAIGEDPRQVTQML